MNRFLTQLNADRAAVGLPPITAAGPIDWEEVLHPRDEEGKFRPVRARLPGPDTRSPKADLSADQPAPPPEADQPPPTPEPPEPPSAPEPEKPTTSKKHGTVQPNPDWENTSATNPSFAPSTELKGEDLEKVMLERGYSEEEAKRYATDGKAKTRDGKGIVYTRYAYADMPEYKTAQVDVAEKQQKVSNLAKDKVKAVRAIDIQARTTSKNRAEYDQKKKDLMTEWEAENSTQQAQDDLAEAERVRDQIKADNSESVDPLREQQGEAVLDSWDKIAANMPDSMKSQGRDWVFMDLLGPDDFDPNVEREEGVITMGFVRGVGTHHINLSPDNIAGLRAEDARFVGEEKRIHPSLAEGDALTYILAHEYGHSSDDSPIRTEDGYTVKNYNSSHSHPGLYEEAKTSEDSSTYGTSSSTESRAEMFAEYILNARNLAPEERSALMQQYVETFGWDMLPDEYQAMVKAWEEQNKEKKKEVMW